MDPLSLTASAIAIIQLTSELLKETRAFYLNVRNAPKDVEELSGELDAFAIVLARLKNISQQIEERNVNMTQSPIDGSTPSLSNQISLPTLQQMLRSDSPLDLCYRELLEFQKKLTTSQSRLKTSLKWPFQKGEVTAIINRLRNLRSILDTAIMSDQLALNIEMQDRLVEINKRIHKAASSDLSFAIGSWLYAPDPSSNLAIARKKRHQDTGVWLLESQVFKDWQTKDCSLLWLHGKAGAGKTVLSSTAIHLLLDEQKTGSMASNVLYFYFDFQNHEKQLVQTLLKSLIVQLLGQSAKTVGIMVELYNSHFRGCKTPELQDLKEAFRKMISYSASVYLVIDALDECNERQMLLEALEEIKSWNQRNLHVLATSRRETEIEDSLVPIATSIISLEDNVIQGDIALYIQYQLQHDTKLARWPDNVREEIKTVLLEGANGMFRWVECQLDAIRGCMKLGLLRKALRTLPKTLDDTYARILCQIPEDYIEDVRRVLLCLIYSYYPLSIHEIADSIAISLDKTNYYETEDRLSEPRDILTICSGLVIATDKLRSSFFGGYQIPIQELRLAHFSVKEYLTSERILSQNPIYAIPDERLAHETLARLCTRYLLWCHEEGLGQDFEFLSKYALYYKDRAAFAPYAASSWSRHLLAAQPDDTSLLQKECLDMLDRPSVVRDTIRLRQPWFRHQETIVMRACGSIKDRESYNVNYTVDSVPPVYYASLLGLDQILLSLIDKGEEINGYCTSGTSLAAAAAGGHYSTVQLLVERGADINGRTLQINTENEVRYSRTPLHEAIVQFGFFQNEALIKLLLAQEPDVNISRWRSGKLGKGDGCNTPLQAAVSVGATNLVELLIKGGADPNAHATYEGTAIETLCRSTDPEDLEVMKMLLDAGADPNVTADPDGKWTPLYRALIGYNLRAVHLLVQYGVSRYSLDPYIVPHIQILFGQDEHIFQGLVKTLVHLRPDFDFSLLLLNAVKYDFAELVEFLLLNGIAPNSERKSETSVLSAAAFTPKQNIETVKNLLNAKAALDDCGRDDLSPLQAAAVTGKSEIVKLLIERGAWVDYPNDKYGTPIQIARSRLENVQNGSPNIQKAAAKTGIYTVDEYFSSLSSSSFITQDSESEKREIKIDVPHSGLADYQAVIDILSDEQLTRGNPTGNLPERTKA